MSGVNYLCFPHPWPPSIHRKRRSGETVSPRLLTILPLPKGKRSRFLLKVELTSHDVLGGPGT